MQDKFIFARTPASLLKLPRALLKVYHNILTKALKVLNTNTTKVLPLEQINWISCKDFAIFLYTIRNHYKWHQLYQLLERKMSQKHSHHQWNYIQSKKIILSRFQLYWNHWIFFGYFVTFCTFHMCNCVYLSFEDFFFSSVRHIFNFFFFVIHKCIWKGTLQIWYFESLFHAAFIS